MIRTRQRFAESVMDDGWSGYHPRVNHRAVLLLSMCAFAGLAAEPRRLPTDGRAVAAGRIVLRAKPDPKTSGTSYPAGIAVSPDGRFLYAAENLGDALAVVDLATGGVAQRLETGRYPYAVAADGRGNVYVS